MLLEAGENTIEEGALGKEEEPPKAAAEKPCEEVIIEGGKELGEDASGQQKEDVDMAEEIEEEEDEEEDIYIPQAEYTAVCNADFAPLICNDFVSEFMEKEHGAC